MFDGIEINRIQIISYSTSAISNLSDSQIQDIINDFPKKATNTNNKNSVSIWNEHVTLKTNKTDTLANPMKVANVPFAFQSKPIYNHIYFCNKTLDEYFNLYREFSSENFDYYGITDKKLYPLCKLGYDNDKSIEGRYKAESYFIKCEQRKIEIVA